MHVTGIAFQALHPRALTLARCAFAPPWRDYREQICCVAAIIRPRACNGYPRFASGMKGSFVSVRER